MVAIEDLQLLADPWSALGEQSSSDDWWTRRMRLHQTWWRTFRLGVPPGVGPSKTSTVRRGNMLDGAAAEAGLNFISPEAFQTYLDRLALSPVGVDPWRTSHNLLASQPLAFNVFGHLSHHLHLATGLFADLLGQEEVAEATSVEVERLSDALGDHTAFDAFATYRRPDGSAGCVAIETKLTEPFSQQTYDWARYTGHSAFDPQVWATSEPEELGDLRWSQLFRNHLLACAEVKVHPGLGEPMVLVVHHPADRTCGTAVDGYRALLTEPDQVRAVDLGRIAASLESLVDAETDTAWHAALCDRYLNLDLSAPLLDLPR